MSRDTFLLIQSLLHFSDSTLQPKKGDPNYNPLYKIQPVLDLTVPTYAQVYQPRRDLSVDESMIKYKGRLAFRQYMPDILTKYGIKDFVLAESDTGYCLKFMTYTGKYSFPRKEIPLTSQVVLELLRIYERKGHIVYMNNFYTSPELFCTLETLSIGACGTARSKYLKPEALKLKRGDDPVFMRAGNLVARGWQDVKRVACLSTVHTNNTCEKTICKKDNPEGRLLDKPVTIEEYNAKMSGVDRLDQMLGSYAYSHKSVKWYQAVYHCIIALTNGHILHKCDNGDSCLNAAKFRKQVVDGLLAEYVPSASIPRGRPSGKPLPNRLSERRHFPATYDDKKYKPDCEVRSDRSKGKGCHQCNTYFMQCDLPMHAFSTHSIQKKFIQHQKS